MTPELNESFDAGAFNTLSVQCRVLKTGAGDLTLEHAAVNEPDAFLPLAGATWNMSGVTGQYLHIGNFLRFIPWKAAGNILNGPIALLDIIAKE